MKHRHMINKFNNIMDDYAKILCKQFGYNFEDCFWIGDDRTDCFALGDSGYFITMADIINIVENDVDYETFAEYDYYNRCMHYARLNHPDEAEKYNNINLSSWIKGCPRRYKEEELKEEENLYWKILDNEPLK